MRHLLLAGLAAGLTSAAALTAHGETVLVLDASASMWGQVDGTAKITLAQGVVDEWLETLPRDSALGLVSYGHRTSGSCSDIEMLIAPGEGTQTDIRQAIAALRPKGETPIMDAIRLAEDAMSSDTSATVILVADGIDTCTPDPCAAASTMAERRSDVTVHVVGLDIDAAVADRELRCIADATGGTFRTVSDAAELADALTAISSGPELTLYDVTLRAVDSAEGSEISDPLVWRIRRGDTLVAEPQDAATVTISLGSSTYEASVARPDAPDSAVTNFTVTDEDQIVTVTLPTLVPEATLGGPDSAPIGSTIDVRWDGPGAEADYVSVARPDTTGYETYSYVDAGSPLPVRMPSHVGNYELRYIRARDNAVLATRPIAATPIDVELELDTEVDMGAPVPLVWLGPGYEGDYISVARTGEDGYVNFTYTREGSPLRLLMPPEPGHYEVRYVMALDATVLGTRDIEVLPVGAKLYGQSSAKAGAELEVEWDGPDYRNDYIAIAEPGSDRSEAYAYTRSGSPLSLTVPLAPGRYELRYVMDQADTVLAAQPLEVLDVTASLESPETARAGAPVVVSWDGPGYDKDYLSVAQTDNPGYAGFRYVRDGNPLILDMPSAPGEYEIRYVASSVGETVLARQPITLTPVEASITAPDSVPAGGRIPLSWEGPEYRRDYVAIARAETNDRQTGPSVYTSDDSPAVMAAPEDPGQYELRYHLGSDGTVLARRPITVTE